LGISPPIIIFTYYILHGQIQKYPRDVMQIRSETEGMGYNNNKCVFLKFTNNNSAVTQGASQLKNLALALLLYACLPERPKIVERNLSGKGRYLWVGDLGRVEGR